MDRKFIHKFQEKKDDENSPNHYMVKQDDNTNELNIIAKSNNMLMKQSTIGLKSTTLPTSFLLPNINKTPINNQGNLGSCVANAYNWSIKYQNKNFSISRLFLYNLSRWYDGSPMDQDVGTYVSTPCNVVSSGYLNESSNPYVISNFNKLVDSNTLRNVRPFRKFIPNSINQDLISLKTYLFTKKCPIIFGILVYSSFISQNANSTGIIPMPNRTTEQLLGGHCIQMVGYDDTNNWFVCINSWGTSWGDRGKFYLPYNYVLDQNLSGDFYGVQIQI